MQVPPSAELRLAKAVGANANRARSIRRAPEYRRIDDAELLLIVPAAEQEPSRANAKVVVHSGGRPLPGADLLFLYPNNTWTPATTDSAGMARAELHTTTLPITVFAAAAGHAAALEGGWTPARGALAIELKALPAGGSVIFPEATGQIPGLAGTLNPIREEHDRTWLCASNIAIDDGRLQPVSFVPGAELRLTDAHGKEAWARIVEIVGRSALVEYRTSLGIKYRPASRPKHEAHHN